MANIFFPTENNKISAVFVATFGCAPGATYLSQAQTLGATATAQILINATGLQTPAELAALVMGKLGVTTAMDTGGALLSYITAQFTTAGVANSGQALVDLVTAFPSLGNHPTYAATYGTAADAFASQTNTASAYSAVSTNNSTDITVLAAVVGTAGVVAGTTFTLTTSADTGTAFTGTANNDTFVATIGTDGLAANGTTLNAGDVLTGGAGTDTLNISISGTSSAADITTSAVTLTGIENISVSNFQTDNAYNNIINLSQASGVTGISVASSAASGDTAFTNVAAIATAAMGNGAGDLSITYTDAAVAGTADAQTLNLTGQTAGSFTAAAASTGGVETITITSQTAANTVQVTSSTATGITVTGDQKLTLTEGMTDTLTSVNASALSAAFSFTHNEATAISIAGGTANDTITFSADNFTSADSVDGGAGTDTLSIATTIAAATTLANVTNVEVLKMTGNTDLTLAANVVPTTFTTADGTSVVTLNTGYTAATTVNLGVTGKVDNAANVVMTVNATAANMLSGADITVTGGSAADTLNITTGTAEDIVFASLITNVDTVSIVDKGDAASGSTAKGADIKLSLGNYATSLTVNASALDTGTVTSGTMGADDETIYVDGASVATATVVLNVTGGGGADTLVGGAGNDILNGGAGNDSILGSAGGVDSISGGDGDDTVDMQGLLTSADTIDGGAGTDTLIVTSLSATALGNVTNVETLSFNGTGSLSANLSFTTIDMTNGALGDSLTLATGYTAATTVAVDQDTVVNTAGVVLTVTGTDAEIAAGLVTGSTTKTTDTLNIKAATNSGTAVVATTDFTGVDSILIVDGGDDASTGDNPAGDDIALTLTSYATALTIDATALDAGTVTSGSMNNDYENLIITGASAKTLTVTGGSGADTLAGSSDAAAGDSLTGGAGNDTFAMSTNLTYLDTIAGGDGTDTITTGAAAVADVAFMKVTTVESLTLAQAGASAATLATFFDATGISTVTLHTTAGAVDAAGTQTGHTFVAAAAVSESVTGGVGNDTFKFGATGTLDYDDDLVGGSGTDTISINNNVNATLSAYIDLSEVTGIENVTLLDANGDDTTTPEADAVAIYFSGAATGTTGAALADNATNDTDVTITVSGAVITDSLDTLTVDASNIADTDYLFNITGGAAGDTLTGGAAVDTISGGDGNDSITGGLGGDSLTGGAGNDIFVYAVSTTQTASPSGSAAVDTVADFVSATDVVEINLTIAGAASINAANVGTAASNSEGLALLSSKAGEYFFNTTTKQVVMDVDGNGLIQATDLFVTLTGATALAAADVDVNLTVAAGVAIVGGSGAETFDVTGAGNFNITAGAGNDTFNATQAQLDTSDTLIGGDGTDTLNIAGTGATSLTTDARIATIENITFTSDTHDLTLTNQTEAFNITTANGTNNIVMSASASLAHSVTGGSGVDTVTVTDYANLNSLASVAGGASDDVIAISTADINIADAGFAGFTSVEVLSLTGASTAILGANATTAGIVTVVTGNDATSITSTQTALAVTATALADNATLTLLGTANYTVTGLQGNLTVDAAHTGNVAVTLVSVATATVAFGTNTTGTHSVIGTALTDGQILTMTGSDVASASIGLGDLTATSYAGALTVTTTGTGTNAIVGGTAADNIAAGAGADTVTGGTGGDTIDVGAGDAAADIVKILTSADAQALGAVVVTAADVISNFTAGAGGDILEVGNGTAGTTAYSSVGSTAATAASTYDGTTDSIGTGAYLAEAMGTTALNAAGLNGVVVYEATDAVASSNFTAQAGIDAAVTALVTAFGGDTSHATASMLFVVYDSQATANAAVFRYAEANTTMVAGDLSLVAVLTGVGLGNLTDANFM